MFSKKFTVLLCLALVAAPLCECAAQGTSGSQFLGIGMGARSAGMGGACVSLADGRTGLFWNPAGLVRAGGQQVSVSHVAWLDDASYQFASYARPFGERAVVGLALEQGSLSWDNTGEGDFEAGDFSGAVGYGRLLRPNLGVGGSVKYLASSLGDESASSFALDLGVVYRFSESMTFGAAARNLGPAMTFVDESDPLPTVLTVGGSYRWRDVLVALDVEKQNDLTTSARFGVEYGLIEHLTLRGGAISGDDSALSPIMGGLGVNWGERWELDYAYRPADLGGTHWLALSAGLGGDLEPPAVEAAEEGDWVSDSPVPRVNLTVLKALVTEAVAEAVDEMGLAPDSEIYLAGGEKHDARWLIDTALIEELTKAGHVVKNGPITGEAGERTRLELTYKVMACETAYPRAWREWVVGRKRVERSTRVDLNLQLTDEDRAIVWAGSVQRTRRDIVPGSRLPELAAPGHAFASPVIEGGGWGKIVEPVVVAGIVGGLIYLFYTSKSTD